MPLRSESMASLIHAGSAVAMWMVSFILKVHLSTFNLQQSALLQTRAVFTPSPCFFLLFWERRKRVERTHEFWSMIWSSVFWLRLFPFWHIVMSANAIHKWTTPQKGFQPKPHQHSETTIKTRQGHHQTNRPTPCPTFGDIPSLFLSGPAWHGVLLRGRDEAGSGGQDSQDTALGGGRWRGLLKGCWLVEGGHWVGKMGRNSVNNWIFKQKSNEKIFESRWMISWWYQFFFLERTLLKGIEI